MKHLTLLILSWHAAVLYGSTNPCLTWEIYKERLVFLCRIIQFSYPVSLMNSKGQMYASCTFKGNDHDCTPVDRKDLIDVDYSRKHVIFTIAKLNENMNGIWVCVQDNLKLTTHVSLSKGIIYSTGISITGIQHRTSNSAIHVLYCFSCREPDYNNAEFLVNNRSEDSITYKNDTGKCIYRNGECYPDECNCTANMFMRVFQFKSKSYTTVYSCEMLFTDTFTNAKFSKLASVVFNGKGFSNKISSTTIIKAADDHLTERFTTGKETKIATERVPTHITHITPVTTKPGNIPEGNAGGLSVVQRIHLALSIMLGISLGVIVVYLVCQRNAYRKRR